MSEASYGYTRNLGGVDFEEAESRTVAALKQQGFGILTEIDVKATLKAKIDVDFRKYKILGACNPPLANKALSADPMVGLLLPCNVILFEEDDGTVTVSFVKPSEIFKVVDNPAVAEIAGEVETKILRAVEAV